MKVTVERVALLKSLGHVHRVVERRNTIPILSNVLLRAEAGRLALRATDLDLEVTETLAADVGQPGAITVPAHVLYDIIRKLPDGSQVSLETTGDVGQVVIRSGRSRFNLQALPETDFPDLAAGDLPTRFMVASGELKRLIEKTQFAISTEETRYYLNGIYLHAIESSGKSVLRAVATDGHRLARVETPAPAGCSGMPGVIVPRKAVAEARRLLDDAPEIVTIEASDSKIVFRIGEAVLTSKLIDGSFPDYQRVIPKDNNRIMVVPTKLFKDAVDRVATVSAERSRSVKLSLSAGRLMLAVTHSESGHGAEDIEAEYDSEPMEIGFNAKYLLDVAGQIESEETRIEFNDAASPARVIDAKDAGAEYVLMPLRV